LTIPQTKLATAMPLVFGGPAGTPGAKAGKGAN